MPRRPRVFVEGMIVHVYNRVGRGEAPFKLDAEAERFWSLLHEVKRRDGLSVYAWCIMPNHYHLAVRTGTIPLWRSIRFLQHRYALAFNRRCKVLGPLWQSRYKARPVREQGALLRLLAYIHLNPVGCGRVDDPGRYRWSGHRDLMGRSRRPLVDVDRVFELFGGHRREALHAYVSLLRREREEPWMSGRLESLPWWTRKPVEEPPGRGLDALGRSSGPLRRRVSVEKFLERVTLLLGLDLEELASA
jgi:putative transposase